MTDQTLQQPKADPVQRPSLFDPCTCRRDGKPCGTCRLWDIHLAWFEGRPDPVYPERKS